MLEVYCRFILFCLFVSLLNARFNLLCICSLTGGMGTAGLNTPVVIPTASVLGAAPAAAPVLPTVPGLGSIHGTTFPITTPSIDLAPPSECLLLKNMFDPSLEVRISLHLFIARGVWWSPTFFAFVDQISHHTILQTEPDFDLDIRDDVQEECSKFGQLKHIFVDK